MKTQTFRLSRSLWVALTVLFALALTLSPLTPAGAGMLQKPANQPAIGVNQDVGGQDENGSSAPVYQQTSAFLAGKVAVGVVAIESNGLGGTPNQENWTTDELNNVRDEIRAGLQKWVDWKPDGLTLEFVVDITGDGEADDMTTGTIVPVEIDDEPIIYTSGTYDVWTRKALVAMGYTAGVTVNDVAYEYANDLRTKNNADWAFVLVVVDSSDDNDDTPGAFAKQENPKVETQYMISNTFGPLAVMTYNNGPRGIANMEWVTAQLVARMFGAGFQLEGSEFQAGGCGSPTKKFGYLGIANSNCAVGGGERLMYHGTGEPDSTTKQQVGWRDTDEDGIVDPLDTRPSVLFSPYPQNPTTETTLTYEEPSPNPQNMRYRAYDNPLSPAVCLNRPTDECFHSYYHNTLSMG